MDARAFCMMIETAPLGSAQFDTSKLSNDALSTKFAPFDGLAAELVAP